MSDTRAAIRELRSLSEKRSTQGLTELERSRLAELRERLGLPSEPAEVRSGGAAPVAAAPVPAQPVAGPPAGAVALPRLQTPGGTVMLPTFETPPIETVEAAPIVSAPPASQDATEAASPDPDSGAAWMGAAPVEQLPQLDAAPVEQVVLAAPDLMSPEPAAELPDVEPGPRHVATSELPVLDAGSAELALPEGLPELDLAAAEPVAPEWSGAPEPAPPAVEAADEDRATDPQIDPVAAGWTSQEGLLDGLGTLPSDPEPLAAEAVPAPDALQLGSVLEPAEVAFPDAEAHPPVEGEGEAGAPRLPSLAERIDALDAGDAEAAPEPESLSWGAVPVEPAPEPPLDLGATPLDVADPSDVLGLGDAAAPIELSSADVILLENEGAGAAELGGQPTDPVPLAALHEFVGAQPEDPRALPFEDQGEQPTFAPEDLQATGAELASEPDAFLPPAPEALPELEPEPAPPPAPAAPRVSIPRPPAGPPPAAARPAPPAPEVRAAAVPPPPPASAGVSPGQARPAGAAPTFALGEDGRKMPALSAAQPEPPHLSHSTAHSGPFARGKAVLFAPAALDVMEDGEAPPPEPGPMPMPMPELEFESPLPPPPPPATDVATGAEVFGSTYLSPTFVDGEHRVVLHTLEGQVRRGLVKDLDLLDPVIRLAQPGRAPEAISADRVKAIFFMQEPGTPALPSAGRRIRVGFADGRQIVGFSEDVDSGEQGFFLIPADTRTHTARIYVFRAGVQSISPA